MMRRFLPLLFVLFVSCHSPAAQGGPNTATEIPTKADTTGSVFVRELTVPAFPKSPVPGDLLCCDSFADLCFRVDNEAYCTARSSETRRCEARHVREVDGLVVVCVD